MKYSKLKLTWVYDLLGNSDVPTVHVRCLKTLAQNYLLQETFPNYPLKALVTLPAVPSYKDKHNIFSYFVV